MTASKTQPTPLTRAQAITSALDSLSANHGIGSVISVRRLASGGGDFTRKPYGMREQVRTFRTLDGAGRVTVFALGHRRTLACV